jgi:ABC-type microcin C transport system permease subunit YejE
VPSGCIVLSGLIFYKRKMIKHDRFILEVCNPSIKLGGQAQWLTPVILATQEADIRRITVKSKLRQKVPETPISTNNWALWHAIFQSSYMGNTNRRIAIQSSPSMNTRPYWKIN